MADGLHGWELTQTTETLDIGHWPDRVKPLITLGQGNHSVVVGTCRNLDAAQRLVAFIDKLVQTARDEGRTNHALEAQ